MVRADRLSATGMAAMTADMETLSAQHVREFSATGRRYGPAMSTQAAREIGQELIWLRMYREHLAGR